MTRVLHIQKVSGISGSEGHLLSLLPLLRDRGFERRWSCCTRASRARRSSRAS